MSAQRLLLVVAIAALAAGCSAAGRFAGTVGTGVTNLGTSAGERVGVVRNDVLTDAQQVIANMRINAGEMTIEGHVDRADTSYEAGQPIALSVKVSKNAYVAILSVRPNGSTTLLYPNRKHPKADIAANSVLTVPSPDDPVSINAEPAGIVLFEFIASTAKDPWLFNRAADKGSDFADLGGATRSIAKYITGSLKVNKGPETAATYLTVRISK